jgi:hypothetical protein
LKDFECYLNVIFARRDTVQIVAQLNELDNKASRPALFRRLQGRHRSDAGNDAGEESPSS